MSEQNKNLDALQDIKSIMERSSRFISLSGWSGISAGLCALAGAAMAKFCIHKYYSNYTVQSANPEILFNQLILIAALVFITALGLAFLFTFLKVKKESGVLWGLSSKKLLWNTCLPMLVGAIVILRLLMSNDYFYIAAFSLIFYALGLINGSKYTLGEVRYLGYAILILGLANLFLPNYSLFFWTMGFGIAHVAYGIAMWYKYDRNC
jgi:F0F1-type ATP synthase membrane subunit c/vacuolar-type H+-ATPase subunit K